MTAPLYAAVELFDVLRELGNPKLIASAQEASNQFSSKIYLWSSLFDNLANKHMGTLPSGSTAPFVVEIRGAPGSRPTELAQQDIEARLAHLTLANARMLDKAEVVSQADFDVVAAPTNFVQVPFVQASLRMSRASLIIEAIIMVTLLWFWLNLRELSRKQPSSPSTILSVFDQTAFTRVLFYLGVWAVVTTGGLVAFDSFFLQRWNAVLALGSVLAGRAIVTETRWYQYLSPRLIASEGVAPDGV